MEPSEGRSVKGPAVESLNVAIAYTTVSAFMVGIEVCMIGVEVIKGNGPGISIWAFSAVAFLFNTFLGVHKIRKAARTSSS
jgi:hypothetical protein